MSYSDKLKDPRWQKKRLEVMQRDSFTCVCCGNKEKTLHIHHRYYVKADPWDYPNDALDTLCCDCHAYVEGLKKRSNGKPDKPVSNESFSDGFEDPDKELYKDRKVKLFDFKSFEDDFNEPF